MCENLSCERGLVSCLFNPESQFSWDYDREADVLYLSIGAEAGSGGWISGMGSSCGTTKESEEVVGMTLIGLKNRLLKGWGRVCSPETHFPGTCAN